MLVETFKPSERSFLQCRSVFLETTGKGRHLLSTLRVNSEFVMLRARWNQSRAAARLQLLVAFSVITIICGGKGIAHQSEVLGK